MEERRPYRGVPFSERRKPLGLIAKYPNYEPFHPPPREDFEYPTHMHPPPPQHRHAPQPRDHSSPPPKQRRHDDDRHYYDNHHHPTSGRYSRSPSPSKRRDFRRRRSYSRDGDRRRSYSREGDRRRSYSREGDRRRSYSREGDGRRSYSREGDRRRSPRVECDRRGSASRECDVRRTGSQEKDSVSHAKGEEKVLETDRYWERNDSEEGSEVELEEELLTLSEHVHDRKTLLTQAIRSLRGKRLKAMIPPLLRETSIVELERRCLQILEQLDPQTVLNILDGRMAKMVEESATKDEDEDEEEEPAEVVSSPTKAKKRKAKKKEAVATKKIKKKEVVKKKRKKKKPEDDAPKTLMELLELEFRAKAIKALLRTQGVSIPEDISLASPSEENVSKEPKTEGEGTQIADKGGVRKSAAAIVEPDTTTKVAEEEKGELEEEEELEEVSSEEEEKEETMMEMVQKVLEETVDGGDEVDGRAEAPSNCGSLLTRSYSTVEEDTLRSKLLENYARRQSTEEIFATTSKFPFRPKAKSKTNVVVVEDDVLELHAASSGEEDLEEEEEEEEEEDFLGTCEVSKVDVVEEKAAWDDILEEVEDTLDAVSVASNGPPHDEEKEEMDDKVVVDEEETNHVEKVALIEEKVDDVVDNGTAIVEEDVTVDRKSVTVGEDEENVDRESVTVDEEDTVAEEEDEVEVVAEMMAGEEEEDEADESAEEELENLAEAESPEKSPESLEEGEIQSGKEETEEDVAATSPISEVSHHFSDEGVQTPSSPFENTKDDLSGDAEAAAPSSPVEFITEFEEPKSEEDEEEEGEENVEKVSQPAAPPPETTTTTLGCENRSADDAPNNPPDENETPVTWYERWFRSKVMQSVVKTNKIQKKLRRKLKAAESEKKKLKEPPILDVNAAAEPIIGSIEEYEKLFGKKVVVDDGTQPPPAEAAAAPDSSTTVPPHEDEDDEADDLWGDIMDT